MIKVPRGGPTSKRYRQLKRELEEGQERRLILTELLHPHRPLEDEDGPFPIGFPVHNSVSAALRLVNHIHPSGWEKCLAILLEVAQEMGNAPSLARPDLVRTAYDAWDKLLDGEGKKEVTNDISRWIGYTTFLAVGRGRKRPVFNLWWRRCMCAFAFARPKTSELE